MGEVIIDPEYLQEMQAEQEQLDRQKWEQMPYPLESSELYRQKVNLQDKYGLPVCIFENEKQIQVLTQIPTSFFGEARKRYAGNEHYTADILVFSEQNPHNIQFVDLSDEDFGTISPFDEEE